MMNVILEGMYCHLIKKKTYIQSIIKNIYLKISCCVVSRGKTIQNRVFQCCYIFSNKLAPNTFNEKKMQEFKTFL